MKRFTTSRGFTIVELLIVIVVIAVLAAITVVAFNGVQDRSKASKVSADLSNLVKAVNLARTSANTTLLNITGSGCTRCACPYAAGDMTVYRTLPKTHSCWVRYYTTLDTLATASGVNLNSLKEGDPWGSPYAIDENEGESGGCNRDTVWSFGSSGTQNGGTGMNTIQLQHYGPTCV